MDLELQPSQPDLSQQYLELTTLPENWALQKPHADYDIAKLDTLIKKNVIVGTKKYNGHRIHLLINDSGEIHLYKRSSKQRVDSYVPQMVEGIKSLNLPYNTLIDGEIYSATNDNSKESLDLLQDVISCGTPELGAQREITANLRIAAFDALVFGGENLVNAPFKKRHELLKIEHPVIHQVKLFPVTTTKESLANALASKWEGCVLWDITAGHKINVKGNTKRWGCYKVKPEFDEDFIVTGFTEGTGDGKGLVGTWHLSKYDITGKPISYGTVGSGLSLDQKAKYMDPSLYPLVAEVHHFGLDEENRVTLATINKVHFDKLPHEVVK